MIHSYVKDAEVILNEIGGVTKAEKESAQSKVKEAFRKIMGSDRDPDLALTNHYAASLLGGELDLREVCLAMVSSAEFQARLQKELASVPLKEQIWVNPLFPWVCVEDEADESLGTVRWEPDEVRARDRKWDTGEIRGQGLGGEVLDGRLLHLTKDALVTATTQEGMAPNSGVHIWSVKKILAGQCGNHAKMGVMLRDTELDQDYNRPFLLNRAWYLDDNGQAWNGATFVARGEPWYDRYCVVTCRLDMDARTLGFYVRKLPATGWKEQLEQGEDPGPLVCLVRNLPEGKELFPFVQDRHAGSGFELSRFRSYLADKEAKEQLAKIRAAPLALVDKIAPAAVVEETAEERRRRLQPKKAVSSLARSMSMLSASSGNKKFTLARAGSPGGSGSSKTRSVTGSVKSFSTQK